MNIIHNDTVVVGKEIASGTIAVTDYVKDVSDIINEIAEGLLAYFSVAGVKAEHGINDVYYIIERHRLVTDTPTPTLQYTYCVTPECPDVENIEKLIVSDGDQQIRCEFNAWRWTNGVRHCVYAFSPIDIGLFSAPPIDGVNIFTVENVNFLIFLCSDEAEL